MKVRISKAAKRFSNTEFPAPSERVDPRQPKVDDLHPYRTIHFLCDRCDQLIVFKIGDFERHSFSDFSNLSEEDAAQIEAAVPKRIKKFSFLDFYCPKCSLPVRVYFEWWVAERGELFFKLHHVAELVG
jgi:hypothetical protein